MNRTTVLVALLTLSLTAVNMQVQAQAPYPSGPYPDRIVLTLADDPATTQTVTWRTDASAGQAVALLAPAAAHSNLTGDAETFAATSRSPQRSGRARKRGVPRRLSGRARHQPVLELRIDGARRAGDPHRRRNRDNQIDANGIVYVGDGAWGVGTRPIGGRQETPENQWYLANAQSVRHFILMTIQGPFQHMLMVDENGAIFEEYPDTGLRAGR